MFVSLPCRPRFASGLAVLVAAFVASLVLTGMSTPAEAAKRHSAKPHLRGSQHVRRTTVRMPKSPTDPAKDAALIVDGLTGKVLYARNETAERHPASLTKMMTLYLLFDALKQGKLTMQTPLPVSYHASIQKPTKLGLRRGQTIPVDTAIRALVIRSANDVAVVVAEALGGTESHFGVMMTERARQMGMRSTNFHNASGLPDPLQITTASDMAVLGRRLAYDFPQYFPYFSLTGFNYKGTWYATHNNLVARYDGADGIKTGYTGASGFNLVSSVVRSGNHVIAVVMGGRTAVRRDLEMVRLLDQTFTQIAANPTLVARAPVPWKQVAQNAPAPATAGFSLPQVSTTLQSQFAALSPVPATVQRDDEDTAEAVRAPDENFSIIHAEGSAVPPKPPVVASAVPVPAGPTPAVRPIPRPETSPLVTQQAALIRTAVNTPNMQMNVPRPQMRPSLRDDAGEGDAETPAPGRNWTIQIGAYADKGLASAHLAAYADKAQDVLARASRIIAPVQSANGHTVYRARFGLFAEREARDVCSRLTQRGQTCFAAVQTR
jgi:D-alanyl-D-alanine carboxypeptidase